MKKTFVSVFRNPRREHAIAAMQGVSHRGKLGSELVVMAIMQIEDGENEAARATLARFELVADWLTKADLAIVQTAKESLEDKSRSGILVATGRWVLANVAKSFFGALWSLLLAPTQNYPYRHDAYPIPVGVGIETFRGRSSPPFACRASAL